MDEEQSFHSAYSGQHSSRLSLLRATYLASKYVLDDLSFILTDLFNFPLAFASELNLTDEKATLALALLNGENQIHS